jgi:hypothetical protein
MRRPTHRKNANNHEKKNWKSQRKLDSCAASVIPDNAFNGHG